jgi:hypothetical protein
MILKNGIAVILGARLLAWSGVSVAEEYQASEFLSLDLASAIMSPKPLGPASEFAPVAVEAKTDRASEPAPARVAHISHPKVRVAHIPHPKIRVAHIPSEKEPAVAHTRVAARHHGNPLDAQAFDTRVQVWPCRSGGICNWKR